MGTMRTSGQPSDVLVFSCNWNNKLECHAFTTFRLHSDSKFQIGKIFDIQLKSTHMGNAILRSKKVLILPRLNNFMALLDTGYDAVKMTEIVKNMYKNKNINFQTQLFDFCLLEYLPD
jgi:hypothetical protein